LRQGEDGQIYDGYVDKGDDDAQIFFDDETIVCPHCYQSVVVTRRSELRQGRTLQALQAETLNIDGYLTVLYWMVARYQDNTGTDVVTFSPHAALIVDRCGALRALWLADQNETLWPRDLQAAQETVNRMTEIADELDEESRPKIYRALDALAQLIKEKAGEAV